MVLGRGKAAMPSHVFLSELSEIWWMIHVSLQTLCHSLPLSLLPSAPPMYFARTTVDEGSLVGKVHYIPTDIFSLLGSKCPHGPPRIQPHAKVHASLRPTSTMPALTKTQDVYGHRMHKSDWILQHWVWTSKRNQWILVPKCAHGPCAFSASQIYSLPSSQQAMPAWAVLGCACNE